MRLRAPHRLPPLSTGDALALLAARSSPSAHSLGPVPPPPLPSVSPGASCFSPTPSVFPFSCFVLGRMEMGKPQNRLLGEHRLLSSPQPLPLQHSSLKEWTVLVRFSTTPGNKHSDSRPRSLVLPLVAPHVGGVTQNTALSPWFLLPDVLSWRFICVVCVSALLHFTAE